MESRKLVSTPVKVASHLQMAPVQGKNKFGYKMYAPRKQFKLKTANMAHSSFTTLQNRYT
jgi:hypothetical protein